jgi:hypothetical protein
MGVRAVRHDGTGNDGPVTGAGAGGALLAKMLP